MGLCRRGQRGVTLVEAVVLVAILGIFAAVGLPGLVGALQRARSRGAADEIAIAARDARAQAMATGWTFRVWGFTDGSSVRPNQFRIEGVRDPNTVPWPNPDTPPSPFQTATQTAERWISLPTEYAGARLNPGDSGGAGPCGASNSFCLTFNFAGMLIPASSYQGPTGSLLVTGGVNRTLSTSFAGGVRIQ